MNPAAAEDGVDERDEDCDGTPLVRRVWVNAMEGALEWNVQRAVVRGGTATLTPTGTIPGAQAWIEMKAPVSWTSGWVCSASGGGGLFLATHDPGTDEITYELVDPPAEAPTDGCLLTDANVVGGSSRLLIDHNGYWATNHELLRVFLAPVYGPCPVMSVDIELDAATGAYVDAHWTAWDTDQSARCADNPDIESSGFGGPVAAGLSADGRYLLVGGGDPTPNSVGFVPHGGICAVNVGGIDADPDTESAVDTNYELAVDYTELKFQVTTILPHPYLDDQYYLGVTANAPAAEAGPLGVRLLQHRQQVSSSGTSWVWSVRRIADAANGLEDPNTTDLAFGSGDVWPAVDGLYVAAQGGGLHEVRLGW